MFTFKNFWSNIVGSTTNCTLAFTIKLKFGSETEISDLDLHFVVQEQVSKLEISMDDSVTVQVFDGGANLVYIALNFEFMEPLSSPEQFIQ